MLHGADVMESESRYRRAAILHEAARTGALVRLPPSRPRERIADLLVALASWVGHRPSTTAREQAPTRYSPRYLE